MISPLRSIALLILALPLLLTAAEPAAPSVGRAERAFVDPNRSNWLGSGPRPLRTVIWSPESARAETPARLPLVLLSHGSGSRVDQMEALAVTLAGQGFIAAAVEHNGSKDEELGGELAATDFFGWERARDLSVMLDALLADATFGPRVDRDRIGAAGFSLGATTVLWLGGARLDLELLRTQSPPAPPFLQPSIDRLIAYSQDNDIGRAALARAGGLFRDERIKAIFAHSPAMGVGFVEESLAQVSVPVFIVVGDADVVTPPQTNAARFATHIPGARLVVLTGERGHYTTDVPAEQRAAELAEVAELAMRFFAGTLGGLPADGSGR